MFVGVRLGRERLIRGSYAMCDAPQGIVQTTAPESVSNYDASIVPETLGQSGEAGKVQIQWHGREGSGRAVYGGLHPGCAAYQP